MASTTSKVVKTALWMVPLTIAVSSVASVAASALKKKKKKVEKMVKDVLWI